MVGVASGARKQHLRRFRLLGYHRSRTSSPGSGEGRKPFTPTPRPFLRGLPVLLLQIANAIVIMSDSAETFDLTCYAGVTDPPGIPHMTAAWIGLLRNTGV